MMPNRAVRTLFITAAFTFSMVALVSCDFGSQSPTSTPATPTGATEVAPTTPAQPIEPTQPTQPEAVATPDPLLAPTYAEIRAQQGVMTEAQWKKYAAGLKGKRVTDWQGRVLDVRDKLLRSEYELQIDMDLSGPLSGPPDVVSTLPGSEATKLNKGQAITFSGEIKEVDCFLNPCKVEIEGLIYTAR